MRRAATGFLVGLAVLAAGAAPALAQDDALVGRWRTSARDGVVGIERCGGALCGRVLDAAPLRSNPDQRDIHNKKPALRTRRVMNLLVLENFTGGPKAWKGGPLYDPDSGDRAGTGTLTLIDDDTLAVKGCIAPLLCRTQTWKRAR